MGLPGGAGEQERHCVLTGLRAFGDGARGPWGSTETFPSLAPLQGPAITPVSLDKSLPFSAACPTSLNGSPFPTPISASLGRGN